MTENCLFPSDDGCEWYSENSLMYDTECSALEVPRTVVSSNNVVDDDEHWVVTCEGSYMPDTSCECHGTVLEHGSRSTAVLDEENWFCCQDVLWKKSRRHGLRKEN